jgi:hypothetical protein
VAASDHVLLRVKRFKQRPGECSLAMIAAIANFYDPEIDLRAVREIAPNEQTSQGSWTSEQGKMLNDLGFGSITIVCCDCSLIDWSWRGLKKETVLQRLRRLYQRYRRQDNGADAERVKDLFEWLSAPDCNNRLVIDDNLPRHIRRTLRSGRPVGAYYNWTSIHRFPKAYKRKFDDIRGEEEMHACVIRGFDDKFIHVVDSHTEKYRGKRSKLRKGYYRIPWHRYLVNAPEGGLIIVR